MLKIRKYTGYLTVLASLVALVAEASTITEAFSTNPLARGWAVFGETNQFQWNAGSGKLAVTWDSSKPNSYFTVPLGTVLTEMDDFSAAFDLTLSDFQVTNFFELAVGFLNLSDATAAGFHRGSGFESPNLAEFCFFPDDGANGPSLTATMIDATGYTWSRGGFLSETLTTNEVYRVRMTYTGAARVLRISLTKNGATFAIPDAYLPTGFSGFQLDSFSISSYSGAGQDPAYPVGSILAHGTVDNIEVAFVERPVGKITAGFNGPSWEATFESQTNYNYTLERTGNFSSWTAVDSAPGTGAKLLLKDANPPASGALYRVGALPQ